MFSRIDLLYGRNTQIALAIISNIPYACPSRSRLFFFRRTGKSTHMSKYRSSLIIIEWRALCRCKVISAVVVHARTYIRHANDRGNYDGLKVNCISWRERKEGRREWRGGENSQLSKLSGALLSSTIDTWEQLWFMNIFA